MPATKIWTRQEVLALPDDGYRYELVDGELLVSPSPSFRHQRAVGDLFRVLDSHVRAHRLGCVMMSPADLSLNAQQVVQPDVFIAGLVGGNEPRSWEEVGVPLLCAEVLSPSTARFDRVLKRHRYQRSGVPVYWIVDVDARLVEEWSPGVDRPALREQRLTWQPAADVPELHLDLQEFFRGVWGE